MLNNINNNMLFACFGVFFTTVLVTSGFFVTLIIANM